MSLDRDRVEQLLNIAEASVKWPKLSKLHNAVLTELEEISNGTNTRAEEAEKRANEITKALHKEQSDHEDTKQVLKANEERLAKVEDELQKHKEASEPVQYELPSMSEEEWRV